MLESLFKSERDGRENAHLYNQEAATRGQNAWALYSAFTNYSSYADERNGFSAANTGKDTNAVTMFRRENQAAQWVNSREFKELLAAWFTEDSRRLSIDILFFQRFQHVEGQV